MKTMTTADDLALAKARDELLDRCLPQLEAGGATRGAGGAPVGDVLSGAWPKEARA
jgi:hypothetical protein